VVNDLAGRGFFETLHDLADKPFLVIKIPFNRLVDYPGPRTAQRSGNTIHTF